MMKKDSWSAYLLYAPLSIVIFLSRILPVSAMLGLGRIAGRIGYAAALSRRRTALKNLKIAFGKSLSEAQRTRIVKKVFENTSLNFAELLLIPRLDKEYIDARVTVEHRERIDWAAAQAKGTILLTAHYGNWEIASIAAAVNGYKILFLGREQRPYFLNRMLNRYRETKGCRVVQKGIPVREIVCGLRDNLIIGIAADQSGRRGRRMDFFGRPVFMADGPFRMALKTGCVILPAFIRRRGGRHHAVVEEPIPVKEISRDSEHAIRGAMLRYRDLLEKYIRGEPAQWLWLNKRWKHSPVKTVVILADDKTGHLRQAQAAAEAVRKYIPEAVMHTIPVAFKNNFRQTMLTFAAVCFGAWIRNCFKYLKWALSEECFTRLAAQDADIVIFAGARIRACGLFFARENLAKTINIMRPAPFCPRDFTLSVVPAHDRPRPSKRLIVIDGALNLTDPEHVREAVSRLEELVPGSGKKRVGLILGGNAKNFNLNEALVKAVLGQIKRFLDDQDAELLLSTSRRTPPEAEELVRGFAQGEPRCVFKVFPREKNYDFAVAGILGTCFAVIVSGESISMVSEAASSGTRTIVFCPEKINKVKKVKHDLFLERLAQKRMIRAAEAGRLYDELLLCAGNAVAMERLDDRQKLEQAVRERIV